MASSAPKLSQSLKQLIKLPAALTGPSPAPAAAQADSVWRALSHSARAHDLPQSAWLTLSTASLVTLNSPDALCGLYDYATKESSPSSEQAAKVASLLRDTSLKCISFNGIPRTINSLTALQSHLPASALPSTPTRLAPKPAPDSAPIASYVEHGRTLWDDIYGPHAAKLVAKLGAAHPDMPGYILAAHYGLLLNAPLGPDGSPAQDPVGRRMTSLIAVACLRAQGGVGAQLASHVYGLRAADAEWAIVDAGARAVDKGEAWLSTNEGVEWVLEQVDRLVEVFGRAGGGQTFGRVKAKL